MELSKEAVEELLEEAEAMPDSVAKIALLEQVIVMADQLDDIELGFNSRNELIEAIILFGYPEKELNAFAWTLAKLDQHPELIDPWIVLWNYKGILTSVLSFPTIPLGKIHELYNDFERRYREAGQCLRTYHFYAMFFAQHRGLKEDGLKHLELARKLKRDDKSNCETCELSYEISHEIYSGQYESALKTAAPILEGKMRCHSQPRRTYSDIIIPLLHLGKLKEAARYHKKALRLYRDSQEDIARLANHLIYLSLTKQLDEAIAFFEKHIPWGLKTASLNEQFSILLASHLMFRQLSKEGHIQISVRLPDSLPIFQDSHHYDISTLDTYIVGILEKLATQFDQRNETDAFKYRIQRALGLLELTFKEGTATNYGTN